MDHLLDVPIHIKYLLSELDSTLSPVSTLSRYISTLPSDRHLTEIFKSLGYCEETDCFARSPTKSESISALQQYPQDEDSDLSSDSWEVHRGIKEEFLRTYYEAKLNDLSEPFDLGLDAFDSEEAGLDAMWATPPQTRKQAESISTEESTPRQCRGLKYLTSKVRSITYSKGFFSYKEVSDELVRELELTDGLDREKEEKNILRRVYDALNVLIASGVVVKQGKKYVWVQSGNDQVEVVRSQVQKVRERIDRKKIELKEVGVKFGNLKELIGRNMKDKKNDVIRFPFICVATDEHPDNMVRIECNMEHTEICIKFKKEIKVCKDIDMISKLNLARRDLREFLDLQGMDKVLC